MADQSTQDGANIQQWSYADQPNQNWNVIDLGNGDVAILSQHSGMAITVQGGRDQNGANIIQRTWNNSRQQRWRLEQVGGDFYRIVSVDNGKVLDVSEAGKEKGPTSTSGTMSIRRTSSGGSDESGNSLILWDA